MTQTSTNQPPPDCDPEIFTSGTPLMLCVTQSASSFEGWIKDIAAKSGQRVDWHYVAGRARVLYIGDRNAIADAIYHNPPPGGACTISLWHNESTQEWGPYQPAGPICWVYYGLSPIIEVADPNDQDLATIPRDSNVHSHTGMWKTYSYSREALRAHAIKTLSDHIAEKRKELSDLEASVAGKREAIATYEKALAGMFQYPFVDNRD